MSIWFCAKCDKLRGGIIIPTGVCPKCAEKMERVNPALEIITPREAIEFEGEE